VLQGQLLALAAQPGESSSVLQESLLRAVSFKPRSLNFPNAWVGHLPFAAWAMRELAPRTFVELGTHSGNSFFSFCQAVVEAGLPTRCYAVDTWKGDEHASHYGEEVFTAVSRHHQEHFAAFARLLRMTFAEAVHYFDDESVDLLHIDGLHTYEAVRYDFETWLPKLSPGAVVLFHDTNVRERNFGIWRLWLELEQAYPRHLEFVHSHGLGVLQLNNAPPGKELTWLVPGSPGQRMVLGFFAAMSGWHLQRYELQEAADETARCNQIIGELRGQIAAANAEKDRPHREAARLAALRNSRNWRLLAPPARLARRVARLFRDRADFGALFDARWYLEANPDVREARIDPLEHFMAHGGFEGRSPHPLFDARWYLDTYPDVRDANINPLAHFVKSGWHEGRNPHPLFDLRWYLDTYPDIRNAGVNPLEQYIRTGAAELRNPNRDFDATAYVAAHPDAAANPLLHFVTHAPGPLATDDADNDSTSASRATDVREYLPRGAAALHPRPGVIIDVVIPVYKGHGETIRCLESVLTDPDRPEGTIRVIDDCSPDPELSAWLTSLAADGRIELTRNATNRGFVASVNLGMSSATPHDVVLLNSDTEVPAGFLRRLAAHAYSSRKTGTVTPLSNYAGEMCSYPSKAGGPLPAGYTSNALDAACRAANDQQAVEIPVGRGFCLYIRRDCLDQVGRFDETAFGRGYGEESDFCLRAGRAGWRHLLACDTYVYHAGQVSFGAVAPEREGSWHRLVERYPELPAMLQRQLALAPTTPRAFAATAALFRASNRSTVLVVAHTLDSTKRARLDGAVERDPATNLLLLRAVRNGLDLSVPSLPGHPAMRLPTDGLGPVLVYARACGVSRVEVQHWIGLGVELRLFLQQLGTPVDVTVHEYAMG
jgi:GT2 family glycosyltransferase